MTPQPVPAEPPTSTARVPMLPEWSIREWLNTPEPLTLAGLRGKVVVIHAFQMLCPGCLSHGLPQARRLREVFPADELAVIGLHTVFEHHAVMNAAALRAFNHEYRWPFPIGIDVPGIDDPVPQTMREYGLRGTPSVIVVDRQGRARLTHFGRIDDLVLGSVIGQLLGESLPTETTVVDAAASAPGSCGDDACAMD